MDTQNKSIPTSAALPRSFLIIVNLAFLIYAIGLTKEYFFWDFDDGYIVYRIARNILVHGEWAYNLGEAHNPSTSALNTILIALLGSITGDVREAAHFLGGLLLGGVGILAFTLLRRTGLLLAVIASGWLIWSMATSSTWGIETFLFMFLFLLFVWAEQKRYFSWPIISLLILTRPDALLIAGIKFLKELYVSKRFPWRGILTCFLLITPWVCFSLLSFNQIFPDTLSAKVWQGRSGYWGNGPIYLKALIKHLLFENWVRLGTLVLAVPGMYLWFKQRDALLYLLLFATLQQISYSVMNVPGYHWYFFVLDCTLILAAVSAISRFVRPIIKSGGALIGVKVLNTLVVGYFVIVSLMRISSDHYVRDVRNESYKKVIDFLNTAEEGEGSLATLEVGTIGYYSDRPIVDLVGLASSNPQYINGENLNNFFKDPPLYVLLHKPLWHFERALYDDLRFRVLYEFKNNIEDPYYPMQYFRLREGNVSLSEDTVRAYINTNYEPFKMVLRNQRKLVPDSSALCILDQINGQLVKEKVVTIPKHVLRVSGWAVNKESGTLSDPVVVLTDRSTGIGYKKQAVRLKRSDVAKHLGNPAFEMAGYDTEGAILDVSPGMYEIGVVQKDPKNIKDIYCNFNVSLVITDESAD